MSPLAKKIAGFDLDIQCVNGHDLNAIRAILDMPAEKCRVVILETTKGHGVELHGGSYGVALSSAQRRTILPSYSGD